ncbi:MAG TPA: permease-like cell division protein FtsX [Candidatus Saccharimonadales bacterium]|nr:permease-like cell division protein FtsX [Candidatus Saccharimonadales bacterium]
MKRRFITFGRIVRTGMVNFVRNAWLAVAAMAIMIITLTIILFSVIVNATFGHTVDQIANQVDVSVFLQDTVTDAQAKQFVSVIKKQADVKRVEYLNKEQAKAAFIQQNGGNQSLQTAIIETGNPIPATIHVYPRNLNDINGIKTFLTRPAYQKLQTSDSPSYKGDRKKAIDNITHATNILRRAGIVAVIIFAFISVLIIFNTIQMAIFNRRDELQIMRLLGASTGFIRGPFVVESIIYGVLSAVISVLLINALFITASSSLQATSFGLLDISYSQSFFEARYWLLLTIQLALGIFIGAASSVIATRRYLKFKMSKK